MTKLPAYDTDADPDLLCAGVRIEPDDIERFPLPAHKHSAQRPFEGCPACGESVRALAERRRMLLEAAAERRALKERLDRERDTFFNKQREEYAAFERRRRNAPMPPAMPPAHPLPPLRCQLCGRFAREHTLMENGALACWSPENKPEHDAADE